MRNFWALPAVLRIALASQHAFSVFDDLLAFPQYTVVWPDTFITEDDATLLLTQRADAQESQELAKRETHSPKSPPPSEDALEQTYEAVVLDGQRYLCSIPVIPDEPPQNSTTTAEEARAEEEKELMRASDRGWELLEGMKGNCIYYLSGWWSYSFCYKDKVKQFHQLPPSRGIPMYPPVEDTSVWSFVLGRYPKEDDGSGAREGAPKTLGSEQDTIDDEGNTRDHEEKGMEVPRLESKGSSRYMVQQLSGGTRCDLTGKDRKIDVQFHCNPQSADRIAMIKETSTCSYLMIIDTPRLCNDVAFLPPQENLAHPITCQPVIPPSAAPAWELARLDAQTREAERRLALEEKGTAKAKAKNKDTPNPLVDLSQSTKRPVIGGIEVGAHLLVGSEGKVIEKSVVVGGGKETFLGTVASSDGSQMSVEEMRKLMIKDPKDVERLKADVKKLAGRKGWRLDLLDTPRGREFRGIIDVEEDEEEGKEGGGGKKGKKGKDDGRKGKEDAAGKKGGMRKGEEEQNEEEEWEEVEEGSEEVYKDEL